MRNDRIKPVAPPLQTPSCGRALNSKAGEAVVAVGDATTSVATRVVAVGEATEISVGDGTAMVGVLLAAGVLLGGGVSLGATVRLAVSVASGAAGKCRVWFSYSCLLFCSAEAMIGSFDLHASVRKFPRVRKVVSDHILASLIIAQNPNQLVYNRRIAIQEIGVDGFGSSVAQSQ